MVQLSTILLVLALAACRPDDQIGDPSPPDGDADSDSDGDADSDPIGSCTAVEPYCSIDGAEVLACVDGQERSIHTCPADQVCSGGACGTVVCSPGQVECVDSHTERRCVETGFAWEDRPCGENLRCLQGDTTGCGTPCVLRVFILLDQSGSMGGDVHPTKWEQARDALAALMASGTSRDVEFGLGVFPSGESCGTSAQIVAPVPEADAALVDEYFTSNEPWGSTPLLFALEHHLDEAEANLNDPAYANFILLVSDGSDTCWEENCIGECGIFNIMCIIRCENEADEEVIRLVGDASARLRDERAIRTFVIGFGSGVSDEELTSIASNGGTLLGRWLPASNMDELSAAFDTVLDEMLDCNPIVY
jgi:hypothetical protein